MVKDTILSIIGLLSILVVCFLSLPALSVIIFLIFIGIIIGIIYLLDKREGKKINKKIQDQIQRNKDIYERHKQLYGQPDKYYIEDSETVRYSFFVHDKQKKIYLDNIFEISYKDILSFTCEDNSRIIATSSTKTNTGSAIGRAVVGGVLAGPIGAIIGGSTASKTTETVQDENSKQHDYTIIINVNDLKFPVRYLHIGSNTSVAQEIIGILNIITRKHH